MTGPHSPSEKAHEREHVSEFTGLDQEVFAHGSASEQSLTDVSLWQEIEQNRKSERWLVLFALLALTMVAALVVLRELVFL